MTGQDIVPKHKLTSSSRLNLSADSVSSSIVTSQIDAGFETCRFLGLELASIVDILFFREGVAVEAAAAVAGVDGREDMHGILAITGSSRL